MLALGTLVAMTFSRVPFMRLAFLGGLVCASAVSAHDVGKGNVLVLDGAPVPDDVG